MYICSECGNEFLKWKGQCDFCKEWNTLKEFTQPKSSKKNRVSSSAEILSLGSLEESSHSLTRIASSSHELNTVLGGGFVPGSIILLSGEPGIGKSTLSLLLGKWISEEVIYISAEETFGQISSRAQRLRVSGEHIRLLCENNIETIFESLSSQHPKIVVFDSISVMQSNEISGSAGSISQVRYIAEKIVEYGKKQNIICIIIGHVTKDGNLAGPKTLEHMVDCVLYFEGEKYDDIRILRNFKNRFGSSSEIGVFKMLESGLQDIENPGFEFISEKNDSIGSALSVTLEGSRALIIETEALTTYTKFGYPKRSCRGISQTKLDLIIAVLSKYTPIKLESYDVYCNISRGLSIQDPSIDLALAASIISSKSNFKISKKSIFLGEISLTGSIKATLHIEKRLKQVIKLGFTEIICGQDGEKFKDSLEKSDTIHIIPISHIRELSGYFHT